MAVLRLATSFAVVVLLLTSLLGCERSQHLREAYDWSAGPITAIFNPGAFSTTYELTVTPTATFAKDLAAGNTKLTVAWTGPNCGGTTDMGGHAAAEGKWTYSFTWAHPHPPCPAGNHSDVQVKVDILGATMRTVSCYYQGADSGTQSYCN